VARYVNAGEVRQGSEAKGNAGRVEVRQAAKGAIRKGGTGGARTGTAGTEREVGVVRLGQDRHGNAGTV